jgi:hypothetical protein
VAYLHSWLNPTVDGGAFYYYPNGTKGESLSIPPTFNTAIVFDGSTILHGVDIFRPWLEPQILDVYMNLTHVGNDEWLLRKNNTILRKYHTSDIRISFVWFTECFYEEHEVEEHNK